MKKFTLLAATALVSLSAAAQVTVGLERPKTDGAYDAFTSTEAYVKSADGLSVSFYESAEIAAKRTTTNATTLYRQGAAVQSDFAWNLTCAMALDDDAWFGANDHPANDKFAEHFTFGFDVNVPAGKQLSVSAVELDLLVSAPPTWRVRILNGAEELYNSGNMNKYNGFQNYLSVGNYARITATEFSMAYPEDDRNAGNAADQVEAALNAGFQLLPADLTLAAGDYSVVLDFDYNTIGFNKPLSFDAFTIEGTLADAGAADDATVVYALQEGDTFTSGQTVDVKDGDDVVATITYGEAGGADFTAAKANGAIDGFVAFTEGNGENGNKAGGTFYTIVPAKEGVVTVAVVLNAGKAFYVLEDGTALDDFNGISVDEKLYGTFTFPVQAGKSYKVYCAGSKLGFYGFKYTYDVSTGIQTVSTPKAETNVMYNLRGQRIDAPQQGQIYIMNGHKYIAR